KSDRKRNQSDHAENPIAHDVRAGPAVALVSKEVAAGRVRAVIGPVEREVGSAGEAAESGEHRRCLPRTSGHPHILLWRQLACCYFASWRAVPTSSCGIP